ncbi:hypothetical protein QYE76_053058 [Lolium multiflorum]|uniref:CCHC-type domain-containing protein n=1 Tax=Lolium multiflorum TaxID=4521 RepID=A0AAD8WJQ3_LOLMU|nr:hypothetical protein QYE76_053058 [Lolium multiflorum]
MVGRARPPPPPQAARDEGFRPRRRNLEDEENMYGKLKFNMPKFKGEDDAEAYLSWALKVDKIFRIHNYSGAKKVAMASLEFEDYANTWWEQVVTLREEKGTKTVEEFFKEMELTMMRANIQESENQTIARFFNGLNYPIKRIVEFQQYSNMVELVHQASKAERQVNEDIKYSKSKQYFASKLATPTPTTSVKPSVSSTPSKQPTIQSRMKQTVTSTASSKASTGPSNVTCFKCGTQGHKSFECKNTKVMITMENVDIETLSEGEYEALVQAAVANEEDYNEESGEDPLLCVHDTSPSLVVTRVLTTQPQALEDHSDLRGEGAAHQKESERHKPYMSERKSVLLATKSEWREVQDNPSTTLHYVLICKGPSSATNDLTNIPSSLLSLLKEFQDVFPDELPHGLPPLRGIEHRIDLILLFQTAPPTAPTPKIQRRYNTKYKISSLKGTFEKALALVPFR